MNTAIKRGHEACICLLVLLATPALTLAFGGTITDGNAGFTFNTFGDEPSADLTINGGADRVVHIGWWYHLDGQTREFSFPDPDDETYTGNTSSFFWNDVNGGDFFSARLNTTVVQDGPLGARVHFMMTISNRQPTDLTIDLINAAALQVDAGPGDDSATLQHANDHIRFTSAGSSDTLEFRGIDVFQNFLVSGVGPASVIALLNDAAETDFNNSGLPFGPGDATAGFKTRVVAPSFATFVVSTILSVNEPAAVVRIGACCVPNVGCVDASEENDCMAQGGTFQGNGISCAINPCESACCFPDQSCQFLAQQPCQMQGGTYVPNSDCNDDDGDGRANGCDGCPNDFDKFEPGLCGCGAPDSDTDGDGTLDCNDGCPNDVLKTAPGVCGCGVADMDSDADGVLDCQDQCPADPAKTLVGVCGCNLPDTDGDGDGAADCVDECPADPGKTAAGTCGCGVSDADSDGDGLGDLCDNCPDVANVDQVDSNADGVGDACDPTAPVPQSPPPCGTCAPGVFPAIGFAIATCLLGRLRRRILADGR